MCRYVLFVPKCRHDATLLCDSHCYKIFNQLARIHEPAAWKPDAIDTVPFDFPSECDPGPHNIEFFFSSEYCRRDCVDNPAAASAYLQPRGILETIQYAGSLNVGDGLIWEDASELKGGGKELGS